MSLTRRSFAALPLGAILASGATRAQTAGATVIELFTSQGCSSCPPADALMLELARQPGMIPLSFAVEVWDYLGWKDTLAKPAFTRRQKAYAAAVAGKRVYTPQSIVNGRAHCLGSDISAINRLKLIASAAPGSRISLVSSADGWVSEAYLPMGVMDVRLVLTPFVGRQTVKIGRGENSGRTITYANVVRDVIDLGPVTGTKSVRITRKDVAVDGADGFALLLQAGTLEAPGAILAGAMVDSSGIRV